jgi:CheY-like chemotaxis protein
MSSSVLIVDDNRALAENLAEILEDGGYDATCAATPADALVLTEKQSFDVVLLDVRMPGMDGVELHGILRPRMPSTRFVLMTAFATDERIGVARAAGIKDVLSKPFGPATLINVVSSVCPAA